MILDYLNFPILNLHRKICKYGPHLVWNCLTQQIVIFYFFLSLTEDGVKIITLNPSASDGNVGGAVYAEKPTTTLNSSELNNN